MLDEVGCQRAAIMAELDAGPTALLFAGTRPERTSALVLVHTSARFAAGGDYPIGAAEAVEAVVARFDQLWGSEAMAAMLVPSRAGDARFRRWFAKWQRASVSPRVAQMLMRAMAEVDVRPVLPLVQAPTLILHRRGFGLVPIAHGRYLAEHIAGAKLVELPGSDGRGRARGDPHLQDGPRSGGRLRHRLGRPRDAAVEGSRGRLAAVRGEDVTASGP